MEFTTLEMRLSMGFLFCFVFNKFIYLFIVG